MKRSHGGVLVAIEGIDGTGKTTLQRELARRWRVSGLKVLELREPSRSAFGLRARRASGQDPWTAALAFTEDRRHQRARIDRALGAGTVVLLDRSFYSTLAYQGSAVSVQRRHELERLQREATTIPDRVILLDLPLRAAEERMKGRGSTRAPTERREVLRRASRAYHQMARRLRWVVLDARTTPAELVSELDRRLTPWVLRRVRART
jgi:dTMP kinase